MHPGERLGEYLAAVETGLDDLQRRDVVRRMWQQDHTVWKPDPREISDRLGWMNVTEQMSEQVPALTALAKEVRDAGTRHIVLLGMGGSSLGPEVLRQALGGDPQHPKLIVLDSTVPAAVQSVAKEIDPSTTVFLVSSKSGTTTEPLAFYSYFRGLVEQAVGPETAGQHFIAITDPGSPLVELARNHGFRRSFLNPPDLGGRYSVLTYFGLVPASLSGIDIGKLLDRANGMREGCAASVPAHDNPGARLGATMGTFALHGRDKLALVASPAIASFGLWVEQLIAESTGKEGRGIMPIAGEPLVGPAHYGDDRFFVHLRLEGDDNAETDAAMEAIAAAGQPVLRLDLQDLYDLGAEFFRWEMATAVAGAILGIHPFDQPNVQQAKDATVRALETYLSTGKLPEETAPDSLPGLLSTAGAGDYVAIMAYVRQTPETDAAIAELRRSILERYNVATTVGYGPRFLHSTGQVHKGGPATGVFLQITADHAEDVPIPSSEYTFGVLADAQAGGDLRVLQGLGRRVAAVHLKADPATGIRRLAEQVA